MDPARAPGYLDRRTAALSGVCLQRTVELDNVRLEVRDWPGLAGPLLHVGDAASDLVHRLASALAPRYRIVGITPRQDEPYQVHVVQLQGLCAQFGFGDLVVLAEGLSCASALLLAAWYPETVRVVVLVNAVSPDSAGLFARSLADCPPDWPRIRETLQCRVIEHASASGTNLVEELKALLG